jgi:glycosyltransferase involved in cell wall biosynthesis
VTADAERDPRVRLREALAPADVVATLSGFDALLVPSRLRETGPLVVLEAFAAGIPVIAASSGAIPERVRDGVDGLLFPSGDSAALAGILERFARDGSLRNALTRAVKPPRTIREVARETAALYERVVGSRRRQSDQSAVV